jgi:all-trans-8'-apo-beta-carotenal 15,15'-oxygenase
VLATRVAYHREVPAPTAADHLWHRAFADLPRAHGFEPLSVEGRLPEGLAGTLYRTGASLFSTFGRPYAHWFDGDGAVSAARFDGAGNASGAVRLVESRGLLEERHRRRPYYGAYGTSAPSWWRALSIVLYNDIKNTGNTSVMIWQGRLYALVESSLPTEISTEDLTTLGERDFDGTVLYNMSAHPHYVPARRSAYNFGVHYGRQTELMLYALPDVGPIEHLATIELAGPTLIHDFVATERHLVFFAPPLRLHMLKMFCGIGSFSSNLRWRPEEGTEIIVVPIDAPADVRRFTVPAFYQWHFATAFERGEQTVVDYVRYPDFGSNRWLGEIVNGRAQAGIGGTVHRALIDLHGRSGKFVDEERASAVCEFPRVAQSAADNRHIYVATYTCDEARHGLTDALGCVDIERGEIEVISLGAGQYPSEPVFVRRPDARAGDDGWLLSLVYDGARHRSGFAVLETRELARGPIATAWLDHHLPFTFHGNFVSTPIGSGQRHWLTDRVLAPLVKGVRT